MWNSGLQLRPNNSFFSSAPFAQAFGDPYGRGASPFGAPFFGDTFGNGGSSIPMAQMLPMMMATIIQQQLALLFLAELLSSGAGQCGQCGRRSGGFPNRNWGGGRRLPPGSWGGNTNGASGVVTGTGPGGEVGNQTATFDSVRNQGQYNQFVSGRISVNGRTYRFNSGGHGRGSLPPGQYEVTPHMWSRNTRGMVRDGVGYSFALSNKYDPRVGGTRSALRIHPDGGSAGTQGCIGIVGDAATQRQLREDMRAELARNGGRFTLNVGVPPTNASPTTSAPSTGPTSATAASLDRHLGGAFAGRGQAFVDAANRHGVDPNLLAAIAIHETGNGTSRAVRQNNNPGGLMNPRTNWSTLQRFDSLESGIDAMARNLQRNYIRQGRTTIESIGPKYAPVGAANDPRGLNGHWVSGVRRFYQQLTS